MNYNVSTPLRNVANTASVNENDGAAGTNSQKNSTANYLGSVVSARRRRRENEGSHSHLRHSLRHSNNNSNVLLSQVSTSQYSQYGQTPLYLRHIRNARADIGDVGREYLMNEVDQDRLFAIQETALDLLPQLFNSFFEDFKISDFPDLEILDEDVEIMNTGADNADVESLGFYRKKLIYIIEKCTGDDLGIKNCSSAYEERKRISYSNSLDINLQHVRLFDDLLYSLIINNPSDCIADIDKLLKEKYTNILEEMLCMFNGADNNFPLAHSDRTLKVRFYNKNVKSTLRELEPKDIDTLVCAKGIVIRCSDILPEMTMAAFRCTGRKTLSVNTYEKCMEMKFEQLIQGEVNEPKECDVCGGKSTFELQHNMCTFASKQLIKIVETTENIPQGETPQSIAIYVYDNLIDSSRPGDRVDVTGIFKASGVRINPRLRNLNAVYRTYIDAIHIHKDVKDKIKVDNSEKVSDFGVLHRDNLHSLFANANAKDANSIYSTDVIAEIIEMSKQPNIYEILTKSLAPSIYKRDDIKKGLLCMLFGGCRKVSQSRGVFRSELHVLLCGDPSTAKSQLLQYVHKIAPRGVCTNGKGSTSVGLTAFVSKDPETKEFVLESGAVVLSDRGVCCIDEFDKMDDNARAILHEVMEQQTVSIAKAGIVASLNARTSILASANPINSRYDKRKAVVENINLPPSLFSRFDLIYLVLDCPDEEEDRRLAAALCTSFSAESNMEQYDAPMDAQKLAQYISYATATCNPVLTPNAASHLVEEYIKMRCKDSTDSNVPTASPRQLEALIRMSEALAKMRLDEEVRKEDVVEAIRLMNVATYKSLIDPISGRIDFDQVNLGQTSNQRKLIEKMEFIIQEILSNKQSSKEDIFNAVKNNDTSKFGNVDNRKDFEEAMANLEKEQIINKLPSGCYVLTGV